MSDNSLQNSDSGFILLQRDVIGHWVYKDEKALKLWIYLLIRANYKDRSVPHGNEVIHLKRGQFISGRKSIATDTDIQESKVERLLNMFESEQMIEQKKRAKYRLISITNYQTYQNVNKKVNSNGTTTEQQLNTDNTLNTLNKDKAALDESAKNCLKYFNEKTGRAFKNSESSLKHIRARLKDFSKADVKAVIDSKTKEWKGSAFEKYLRPETIFGNKFESYLNDVATGADKRTDTSKSTQPKEGIVRGQNIASSDAQFMEIDQ